jgi:hypothetical protein
MGHKVPPFLQLAIRTRIGHVTFGIISRILRGRVECKCGFIVEYRIYLLSMPTMWHTVLDFACLDLLQHFEPDGRLVLLVIVEVVLSDANDLREASHD